MNNTKEADVDTDRWYKKLGPGLITGASDDDPSGIATYSQAGAQFGYNMLWSLFFTYPLMVGIQTISARIGRVSGHGIAANIRRHYSPWVLYSVVLSLLIANTINIAANLVAMGDALKLLIDGSHRLYAFLFGLISLFLQIFIPYSRYVAVLKWLTLSLLTYVAAAFVIDIAWIEVFKAVTWPEISFTREYLLTMIAVFGTTISPYLFFWQASQEVEEQQIDPNAEPLKKAPEQAKSNLRRIKLDTYIGMGVSNLVAFFIMLTAAAVLHTHGITDIESSAQAASALKPIAGDAAFLLFSIGIIGTGLLSIPVLAGSAAYATAEAFKWDRGLERKPMAAKKFYGIITAAIFIGIILGYTPINPIKALYWSAVINGIVSIPVMIVMMLLSRREDVMGNFVINTRLKVLGWTTTSVMGLAVAALLVNFFI